MEPNAEQTRKRKNDDVIGEIPFQQPLPQNKRLNTNQILHHLPPPAPTAHYTPGPFGNGRLQAMRDRPSPASMDVDMVDAADTWDDDTPHHDTSIISSPPPTPSPSAPRSPPLGMTLAHYDPVVGGYSATTLTTVEPTMKFERGRTCGANGGHRLEKWGSCMI